MDKKSQYLPPKTRKQPEQSSKPGGPGKMDRIRNVWEDAKSGFIEGWEHPSYKQRDWQAWDQRFLTMQQWLEQNPGKTPEDYRRFRKTIPQPRWNWFQRRLIPPSVRHQLGS